MIRPFLVAVVSLGRTVGYVGPDGSMVPRAKAREFETEAEAAALAGERSEALAGTGDSFELRRVA